MSDKVKIEQAVRLKNDILSVTCDTCLHSTLCKKIFKGETNLLDSALKLCTEVGTVYLRKHIGGKDVEA